MALSDRQLMDRFCLLISQLYQNKKITEHEFNVLYFYGMYNNEHNGVPKLNSWKEVEEYTQDLYSHKETSHK